MANYFNAASNGFGLFHPSGVPKKSFGAFVAFRRLLETPVRLQVSAGDLVACAGTDEANNTVTLLIANAGRAHGSSVRVSAL